MLKGKAESIEEDATRIIWQNTMLPTVIRLRRFIHVPYREMPFTRKNILQRDKHSCQYCGTSEEKLSIDHIIPKSRGGGDYWENVATACLKCNIKKGDRTPIEAKMSLKSDPKKPIANLGFELNIQIQSGKYKEWSKYILSNI
tara:strand:+ start:279 stop:707 length:429 start_codon:yes stop_codon:yes gene_type:complete